MTMSVAVMAQNEIVSGRVIDYETGEGLPGVNIRIQGTNLGTATDLNGNFLLSVPTLHETLIFSFIGFHTQQVPLEGRAELTIELKYEIFDAEELVVMGYSSRRDRTTVTGAISTVRSRELLQSPQVNISNALVGRMPGLLAVQRSGQPGEDTAQLRIRGIGTFSGDSNPLVIVDGIQTDNYNNLDPNEIESVTILKDASATAVYGVRGANGVLIITTRRGTERRPQIAFTSNYAITTFTDLRQSARAYDYVTGYNLARAYDSFVTGRYEPKFLDEEIAQYHSSYVPDAPSMHSIMYPDMDWMDYTFKTSSTQMRHNMSVSGGTSRARYFVSAGYLNQEGLFRDGVANVMEMYNAQPRYQRYNFRSNLDFDVTNQLLVQVNVSSQIEQRTGNTANIARTIEIATKSNPINSPGIVDGRLVYPDISGPGSQTPVDQLLRSNYQRHFRNYLDGSIRANYNMSSILTGLEGRGVVSYQTYNTQNQNFGNSMIRYRRNLTDDGNLIFVPLDVDTPVSFSESVNKQRTEYLELGFEYNNRFAGEHQIGGLLLYNQEKRYDPNLAYLIPAGIQGIVGRATYSFKDRYLAEFNIGYNGTEQFAEGMRFGVFPAYSLGWIISEELFFPDTDFISFLKIRGSYGEVGNDRIGAARFLYLPSAYIYHDNWSYFFGDVNNLNQYDGVVEDSPGNPHVTWERAKKRNIGIEVTVWDGRLQVEADVFMESRDNILASLGTVPTTVGAPLPPYNIGEMTNRGFEVDATLHQRIDNVQYWIRANYTFARNKIDFMDEPDQPYQYLHSTGQTYGQMFGYIADGFYNSWEEVNDPNRPQSNHNSNQVQPGDIRYRDINGDGIIDHNDRVPIGYPIFPESLFGISFGGSYKGFDFSVLFQGAARVSVNYSRHARYGFREDAGIAQYLIDYSWTQERYENGERIDFPRLSEGDMVASHNYQNSTFWIRDASYLRLKNLEVGYTLISRYLERLGLSSARIFANGNNLLTWSDMLPGIDPETHVAGTNQEPYPATRVVNFGLNVQF